MEVDAEFGSGGGGGNEEIISTEHRALPSVRVLPQISSGGNDTGESASPGKEDGVGGDVDEAPKEDVVDATFSTHQNLDKGGVLALVALAAVVLSMISVAAVFCCFICHPTKEEK